ncbi:hypothetical protein MXB_582 [Myxobolus squamalis]|nr:hypothetical protein MXB_582 [Myxobolus squamalis]
MFEGEFLRFYDFVETYLGNPYLSIKMADVHIISLSSDYPHSSSVSIYESSFSVAAIIFQLPDNTEAFMKYFKAYTKCLETWGVTINANNEEKSARDSFNEILTKPDILLAFFEKKTLVETSFTV